jgi:hypothetical protein
MKAVLRYGQAGVCRRSIGCSRVNFGLPSPTDCEDVRRLMKARPALDSVHG